jgi:hypothetical protein
MLNQPRNKKTDPKPATTDFARQNQFLEQKRRDMATRSTLSRLRNRKSALK